MIDQGDMRYATTFFGAEILVEDEKAETEEEDDNPTDTDSSHRFRSQASFGIETSTSSRDDTEASLTR